MAWTLTWAKVAPFIELPVPTARQAKVTAWLTAIKVALDARYGDKIAADVEGDGDPGNQPMFVGYSADAVTRRLLRPSTEVVTQATGPSNVRYRDRGPLGGWFMPDELDAMDSACGIGGTSSVRMPAPDAIRFGNLSPRFSDLDTQEWSAS